MARLAERLGQAPIRAVYASPLERAIETAEPIAKRHGVTMRIDEDFGEMRVGEWEGLTFQELGERDDWRRFNTWRSGTRPPGGELMLETQTRMVRRLDCARALHPDETVAVVSHADPIRAAIAHYLGLPLDHALRFEIGPASVSVVQAGEWGARVMCLNHQGELLL